VLFKTLYKKWLNALKVIIFGIAAEKLNLSSFREVLWTRTKKLQKEIDVLE